jgi:hypothetical protein
MRRTERGFYTLVGWATWKGAKWYVARRLGLHRPRRRLRTAGLVLVGTAAVGGATAVVLSRTSGRAA